MARALNFSLFDQAIISAFGLGLNLLLIAYGEPAQYGQFILAFSLVLLLLGIQNALILTPLTVILPGRSTAEQAQAEAGMGTISLLFVLGGALFGMAIWGLYPGPLALLPALSAYAALSLAREYWRNLYFIRGEASRAFALDLTFVAASMLAIFILFGVTDPVTASIGGMAIGNFFALGWTLHNRQPNAPLPTAIHSYRTIWAESRWALLGAVQTEAQMRGYVLIVEAWRGAAALGTLQAGRVLMSPLTLIATAWGRVVRPRMVEAIHHGRPGEASALMLSGLGLCALAAIAYGLVVALLWPLLDAYIFNARYAGVADTMLLWWAHTTLLALNGVSATLLLARRQFRALSLLGLATAVTTIAGLLALAATQLSLLNVLYLLIAVELLEAIGQLWLVRRGNPARLEARPA